MKPDPQMHEGREAFTRFDSVMDKLLSVSHDELKRREAEYQKQSKADPHRRGRKPKVKPSTTAPASES